MKTSQPRPQPASATLTARVCALCGRPKGTICFRQDGGPFFAHLPCMRRFQKRNQSVKTNSTPTKPARIVFSDEEKTLIGRTAADVWQEIGGDCLQAIADDKRQDVNRVTMSRAHVIEVALDAGRVEEHLMQRRRQPGSIVTDDFLARFRAAPYRQLIAIVKPAFSYTRYGL
jgi:hypothetical protein